MTLEGSGEAFLQAQEQRDWTPIIVAACAMALVVVIAKLCQK